MSSGASTRRDFQARWPGFFPTRVVSTGASRLRLWWGHIPSFGWRCSAARRSGCPRRYDHRRSSGLDLRIVLRTFASIEHAVVADDAHDSMAEAGRGGRAESLRRGPVTPRRQQRVLSCVVDAGKNVVLDQFAPM